MTRRVIAVTFAGPGPKVSGYPYLWVKAVTGFVHTAHCAKCLKGPFLKTSNDWVPPPNVRKEYELPAKAKALYICGVSRQGYAHNLHAPCEYAPGEVFSIEMVDRQTLIVEDARLLTIPALPDKWRGLPKSFTTCRNFRWAVATFGWPEKGRSLLDVAEVEA